MLIGVVTLANLINEVDLMLTISYCGLFRYFYINYYAYKVVCGIVGYNYSCIIDKGVLVGYKRYHIIYGYD
jgi:hypothetical protein